MGLLFSTFQFSDAETALEQVRASAEGKLRHQVSIENHPPGAHYIIDGLNVVVLDVDHERQVLLRGLARLTQGRGGRTGRVRRALQDLGGLETLEPFSQIRFAFADDPPCHDALSRALGGVGVEAFRQTATLSSAGSEAVDVCFHSPRPHCLSFETGISGTGPLFDALCEAALACGGERVHAGPSLLALHHSAYFGDVPRVRELLSEGADPNQPAPSNERWISAASQPTPLNCAIIAHALTPQHVEVVRLLLAAGARVDATHIADWIVESLPNREPDRAVRELLQDAAPHLKWELPGPAK